MALKGSVGRQPAAIGGLAACAIALAGVSRSGPQSEPKSLFLTGAIQKASPQSLTERCSAWVLEGQQSTLFNPNGGKPGTFKAYAVPLPNG